MKYLYKILRMFFCPHKYKTLVLSGDVHRTSHKGVKIVTGKFYDKECLYCGKIKEFRT